MSNIQISPRKGFTLLEVLVSFSILSILLTVIIQSQSETIFFLHKTKKLELVQNEVINKLLAIERGAENVQEDSGEFQAGHPLAGDQWHLTIEKKLVLNLVPMEEVKYRITWKIKTQQLSFESTILR